MSSEREPRTPEGRDGPDGPDGPDRPEARGSGAVEPLACPTCAKKYPLSERFCPDCEMPLVYVGRDDEQPITSQHERAGRIDPQFTGGELVKVAFAQNLAEAQLIQGLLLDQGIPSVERRSRGFDVPDFLAAGPRDILVPQAAEQVARDLLETSVAADYANGSHEPSPSAVAERPGRLLAGLIVALAIAALIVWGLSLLV